MLVAADILKAHQNYFKRSGMWTHNLAMIPEKHLQQMQLLGDRLSQKFDLDPELLLVIYCKSVTATTKEKSSSQMGEVPDWKTTISTIVPFIKLLERMMVPKTPVPFPNDPLEMFVVGFGDGVDFVSNSLRKTPV